MQEYAVEPRTVVAKVCLLEYRLECNDTHILSDSRFLAS